ncbi:hypothetical protein [Glaciihabitans sp. UYNi722]|uniref:hypothetical protein n=1 Tax=Glaciihabitans sp. UYNi722 TaxID=3156344 RepID=UPI0033946EB5
MSIDAMPAETSSAETWSQRLPRWFGLTTLVFAVLVVVLEGVAIGVGSGRDWTAATALAWVVIVLTIVSFLAGLAAVILNVGRWWGVAAMALSVVGNPLVLVWLFAALDGS